MRTVASGELQGAFSYIEEQLYNNRIVPDEELPEFTADSLMGLAERFEPLAYRAAALTDSKGDQTLIQEALSSELKPIYHADEDIFPTTVAMDGVNGRMNDLHLPTDFGVVRVKTMRSHTTGQMLIRVARYVATYDDCNMADRTKEIQAPHVLCVRGDIGYESFYNRSVTPDPSDFSLSVQGWSHITPRPDFNIYRGGYGCEAGSELRPLHALFVRESKMALTAMAAYARSL